MESEKAKEIKRAWWCCGDGVHLKCLKCPYEEKGCQIALVKDTLTLINELESENERLKECYKVRAYDKLREENKTLKDRIVKLEKDNELLRNAKVIYETVDYCAEDLRKAEKRIKELEEELTNDIVFYKDGICYPMNCQGALKQFAERLKKKAIRRQEFIGELAIDDIEYVKTQDIDKTLKEFIKERL